MLKKNVMLILLVAVLLLNGCGTQENTEQTDSENNSESSVLSQEEIFSNRDFKTEYEENCAYIQLNGTSAACESNAVEIEGSTITIKDEGTFVLTGNLENGMIVVDSEDTDKTQIVLNGASIHSKTCAAIYVKQSDKVFITLEADTENELSNGGTFEQIDENEIDGVIFSKADLTLNGTGTLQIESPNGHGIVSKDDLIFTGGKYTIDVSAHGVSANDMLGIAGGEFTITSGEDAVHCDMNIQIEDGVYEINAKDDAIHADETLNICGGKIHITKSYEGLEALDIMITDGDIQIVASDDGLNAAGGTDESGFGGMGNDQFGGHGGRPNRGQGGGPEGMGGMQSSSSDGSILISGGTLYIKASGDGIDANGALEIAGGMVTVCGPTQGDTATLDYDVSGIITGGTFIGTGARNMAQTFSDSKQGVISVSVGNQQAGT
ncbi:MAG: carbohydrate-binding domain-containing protein, partial [Agathobacter sp.]|nr:carbohydrate-binding domain-containing protein [Agathobacter sp.]